MAVAEYRKALALKPDFAEAHYGSALALLATGRRQEADQEFQEAHRISPKLNPPPN